MITVCYLWNTQPDQSLYMMTSLNIRQIERDSLLNHWKHTGRLWRMPSSDSLYFLEDSGKISSNMSSAVSCVLGGCNNTTGGNVTMAPQPCNSTGNESCYPPNSFGMSWYILAIYYTAFISMVIVGAGGNIIVIWIVLAHKRMRTVTNYFLVNLAVADALISILNTLFNFIYMLYMDWPFGRSYCKVVHFISPFTICASVFTFMAIAVDRWVDVKVDFTLKQM